MKKTALKKPQLPSGLDRSLFEQIGINHNLAVRYLLQNINPQAGEEERHEKMSALLKHILPLEYKIYEESGGPADHAYTQMVAQESPDYIAYVNSLKLSAAMKNFLIRMIDLADEGLPLFIFESRLHDLENSAAKTLNGTELVILLCALSVARYSARLWYPEKMGGEDAFRYLRNDRVNWNAIQNDLTITLSASSTVKYSTKLSFPGDTGESNIQKRRRIKWGKVILADAVGLVGGALSSMVATGGASALPNPALGGMPTASAAGLVSAATNSTASAVGQ